MRKKRVKRRCVNRVKILNRRYGKLVQSVIIILALLGFALSFKRLVADSDFLKVTSIEISGTKTFVNSNDLRGLAESLLLNKKIYEVKTNSIEKILSDSFLGAKNITVKTRFPNSVEILVKERVPLAVVTNDNERYFMVDDEGYVLGLVDSGATNLPVVLYQGELEVGYFIDEGLIPVYFDLLSSLDKEKIDASSVSADERDISFLVNKKILVIIGRDKNIINSVKIASELLKQLALEGQEVKKIDLRYDKVIVEY
jgi:cell division septal protein FtsQ